MKRNMLLLLSLFVVMLQACRVEPAEINYGKDACNFCKMNIVDRQHAAELVTQKGKPFKYDAIECLVRDLNRNMDDKDVALLLVADYANPGKLVDAKTATYLISENLPSPMGADLTGFSKKEDAESVLKDKGGELFNWEQIRAKLK